MFARPTRDLPSKRILQTSPALRALLCQPLRCEMEQHIHLQTLDCLNAFFYENKQVVKQLFPCIQLSRIVYLFKGLLVSSVKLVHLAAHHGRKDIIIHLITECNCTVKCEDSMGHTPVHYAVSEGHLEVVRYLVER